MAFGHSTGDRRHEMRKLFTAEGRLALQAVMRLEPLLAFDFDGTLAPIVDHPDHAHARESVSPLLARLGERLPVAILTGRRVADVRKRLGFEPAYVIGSHGAEDEARPAVNDGSALDALRGRIGERAGELHGSGVGVEDKHHSLAFHYRLAPDPAQALACIDAVLADPLPGLRRFGGKAVVNIVAAGDPDKGDALLALTRRLNAQAAVFFGDDVNDEAVFERAPPHWLTVRIGTDDPRSRAMFFLDSDEELPRVLEDMQALVGGG